VFIRKLADTALSVARMAALLTSHCDLISWLGIAQEVGADALLRWVLGVLQPAATYHVIQLRNEGGCPVRGPARLACD
jgi:hypothetical protein